MRSGWHLPALRDGRLLVWPGVAAGLTAAIAGGISDNIGDALLLSGGVGPPTGSALWEEAQLGRCNGTYTNVRLELTGSGYDGGWCASTLAALSPALDTVCCRGQAGGSCEPLQSRLPSSCNVDCAALW